MKKKISATWIKKKLIKLVCSKTPTLKNDEFLIKVQSCSLCGSDIKTYISGNKRVKKGQIIGHEVSGKVIKTKNKNFKLGDKVSIGADVPCNKCDYCLNGMPNCCVKNLAIGHQLEGGFTNLMKVNSLTANFGPVHKFKKLDYDSAAMAEPLACCINGFEKLNITKKVKNLLIFGSGPIGLMLAIYGRYLGIKNIVISDNNLKRLNFAKINGIADYTFLSNKKINNKAIKFTRNKGFDLVFIACPVALVQEMAIEYAGQNSYINFFSGIYEPKNPLIKVPSNDIHYKQITISGSHGSTPSQHKKALRILESKKIKLKLLVTHRYKLKDISLAYKTALNRDGIKVMIKPNL